MKDRQNDTEIGTLRIEEECCNRRIYLNFSSESLSNTELIEFEPDSIIEFEYSKLIDNLRCWFRVKLNYDNVEQRWTGHLKSLAQNCQFYQEIVAYNIN